MAQGLEEKVFCRYFEEEADRQDTSAGLIAVGDPSWHGIGRSGQQDKVVGPLNGL